MTILSYLLGKLGYKKAKGHVFTDADRERAEVQKATNARIRQLERTLSQHAKLDDIGQILNPKKDPAEVLISLIAPIIQNKMAQQNNAQVVENKQDVSDEEIKAFLDKNKNYVEKAKSLDDEKLFTTIKKVSPGIGDNTITRAVQIIRSDY